MTQEKSGSTQLQGTVAAASLVTLQPGAVVSRTLVKKSAGTVTAFAFDAGEGLSEHKAPYDALVMGLEGDAEFTIAGVPHRIHAGELLMLPADQPHMLKAITPFKMLLTMIRA